MNTTANNLFRRTLIAGLAILGTLTAVAQPRPNDGGQGRPPPGRKPEVQTRTNVVVAPRGYVDVHVGNDHYYTHRGFYYRPGPAGLVLVRPPIGLVITTLPIGFARVYYNNVLFFRYNNIYYRPAPGGYVVVDYPPTVVVNTTPTVVTTTAAPTVVTTAPAAVPVSPDKSDYQSIWMGNTEFQFKDGQFFRRTADGLVWCEAPMGAVTKTLPGDATSVWYQDVEYFDCDNVYFRKTPDGFRVVAPPWKPDGVAQN